MLKDSVPARDTVQRHTPVTRLRETASIKDFPKLTSKVSERVETVRLPDVDAFTAGGEELVSLATLLAPL